MKKRLTTTLTDKFTALDFHDDSLQSVTVHRLDTRKNLAKVDIQLRDDSSRATKLLSFRDCGNLRFSMDFDVLADNWFAQTDKTACITNVETLRKFVRSQVSQWHVRYMPPSPEDKPIRKKLASIHVYTLFRVRFYGGTLEVLAKSFTLKLSRNS